MFNRAVLGGLVVLALAACEPDATPLPVDIPATTSPTLQPGTPQPIRYGIDAALVSIMRPDDADSVQQAGAIESIAPPFLDSDLGSRYDVLVALGDLPDASRSPALITISLGLNTGITPLEDSAIAEVIRRAIRPDALVGSLAIPGAEALAHTSEAPETLRTALANAGLPDGFDLSLASLYATGGESVGQQLGMIGIETRITTVDIDQAADLAGYHLILFSDGAQSAVANLSQIEIIDLFTVPISYHAVPELTIEFTDTGFPLAHR